MRIAQVAPLYECVPPNLYGGTERVISYITEELVQEGREVTLFASGAVHLLLVRHENNVGVNVLRRDGDVEILVVK